jgi:hypothetical protein
MNTFRVRTHFATVMFLLALAPVALAQTTTKKKKKDVQPAPTAEPAPEPAPPPPSDDESTAKKPDKAAMSAASENTTAEVPVTVTNELPGKKYYFIGLRYRVTVIPQFLVGLFVNEGGTFVSHQVGAELDMRKDGQSTIPWIAFQTFGFGDTLFLQKNGQPPADQASNWSVVNSGLSGLFLGLDELWSAPLDSDHHVDFEYGFGVGVGVIFGSLSNNWVYDDANGPLVSSTGRHFSQCQTQGSGASCAIGAHQNATIAKVGNYTEPNWFNGGSVPVLFPHIALPQLGIRWKPVKAFEMRLTTGFSLTGFFFGIAGYYGLEKPEGQSPNLASMSRAAPMW